MLDVFILRIIAGILLISSFILIYVVNYTGESRTESYEVKTYIAASLGNNSRAPFRAIVLKSSSSKPLNYFRSFKTREAINLGAAPRSVPRTI